MAVHSTNTGRHTMTTTAKQAKIARVIATKDAAVAMELFTKWIGKAQIMLEVLRAPEHIAAVQTEVELYSNAIEQLQDQQAQQEQQEQQALEAAQQLHKRIEDLLNAAEYSRKQQYTKTADALIAEAQALIQDELDRLQAPIDSREAAVC